MSRPMNIVELKEHNKNFEKEVKHDLIMEIISKLEKSKNDKDRYWKGLCKAIDIIKSFDNYLNVKSINGCEDYYRLEGVVDNDTRNTCTSCVHGQKSLSECDLDG